MSKSEKEFTSRWGDPVADDYQYCHVPGYVLRNYSKCVSLKDVVTKAGKTTMRRGEPAKVDMQDMMFIIHVMAFKYDSGKSAARPGLPTIADYGAIHVTSARRIKQRLMDMGLLEVASEKGLADVYNFKGLHEQCVRLERGESAIENPPPVVTIAKKKRKLTGWATPSKFATTSKNARSTPSKFASTPLAKTLGEELELEGNQNLAPKNGANGAKRKTRSAAQFNPLKDAIVLAFGWSWETMSKEEKGKVQSAAASLYDVGITPSDIPHIYTYCKAKFTSFGPTALAAHQSEAMKSKRQIAPVAATPDEEAPKPSIYGGYYQPPKDVVAS